MTVNHRSSKFSPRRAALDCLATLSHSHTIKEPIHVLPVWDWLTGKMSSCQGKNWGFQRRLAAASQPLDLPKEKKHFHTYSTLHSWPSSCTAKTTYKYYLTQIWTHRNFIQAALSRTSCTSLSTIQRAVGFAAAKLQAPFASVINRS